MYEQKETRAATANAAYVRYIIIDDKIINMRNVTYIERTPYFDMSHTLRNRTLIRFNHSGDQDHIAVNITLENFLRMLEGK